MKSIVIQYNSRHTGAGIKWIGKKSYLLEEGEKVGDGRVEWSSAIGDRGQSAIYLTPYVIGHVMHILIFESLQFEGSYVLTVLLLLWLTWYDIL